MDLNLPIFNQNLLHRHADFNRDFSSVGDLFEKKKQTEIWIHGSFYYFVPIHNRS